MNEPSPPLEDPTTLQRRVVCIAPHSGDGVIGCGCMLAFHAARGDTVAIAVLTDERETSDVRRSEARAAAAQLGVLDMRFLGLPEGALGAQVDLVARIQQVLRETQPELVYAPSPLEHDPDRRAASRATAAALANAAERSVLLYGVTAPLQAGAAFDTSVQREKKRAALRCFAPQLGPRNRAGPVESAERGRKLGVEEARADAQESFIRLSSRDVLAFRGSAGDSLARDPQSAPAPAAVPSSQGPRTTAVVSTWNKKDDVRANLESLRAQTLPFAEIVVVDNASRDGTAAMIAAEFPEVRLIVMPHDRFGACETFNIGFKASTTELTAILDDDILMPPEWLEKATARIAREPATTAILSTHVVEPGMPESYSKSPAVNAERYMSTFRGCASLARTQALREAGYYDERLYIYGNERDLTCRLLNLGYRVLQYPGCGVFHKTPFGIKMGKRSLYYHARNAWLSMLKYAPLGDLMKMPWLVFSRVILRGEEKEAEGSVRDAVGTIGIGRSLRETKGAWWVVTKAAFSVLWNLPYCWKHRAPVTADDFELPLH